MEIKLESGKRYVMRNGEVTGVLTEDPIYKYYPFSDGCASWTKLGRREWDGEASEGDIISEYKEEEPMSIKLEVGKNYRLRNGYKALIVAELSNGRFLLVYGPSEDDGMYQAAASLHENGRLFVGGGDSVLDIISEWKTTRTAKLYPVLYAQGDGRYYVSGSLYETLDSARASTCSGDNIIRLLTEYPPVEVEVEE